MLLRIDLLQASFIASLSLPDAYEIQVSAGGMNISGSPTSVQVLAHVTQPPDWQVASWDLLNGTLTGKAS